MHKFEGLGTTHWVSKSSFSDETESLKMRIHHFTLKMVGGHVCVFYKRFMRDHDLLPTGGAGWRVFKDGADLDLKHLEVMPTFPISNMKDTEKYIQVSPEYTSRLCHFVHPPAYRTVLSLSCLADSAVTLLPCRQCCHPTCIRIQVNIGYCQLHCCP